MRHRCLNRIRLYACISLLLLLSLSCVLASQAHVPTSSGKTQISNNHNDTNSKSFINLPGTQPQEQPRSVEEVLQHGNEVRGGAVKQHDPLIKADYIADTKLPTDIGDFRMRAYRVRSSTDSDDLVYSNTHAMEPIIIYAADKPPFGQNGQLLHNVRIRIHDQCLTSEVFRSRR